MWAREAREFVVDEDDDVADNEDDTDDEEVNPVAENAEDPATAVEEEPATEDTEAPEALVIDIDPDNNTMASLYMAPGCLAAAALR